MEREENLQTSVTICCDVVDVPRALIPVEKIIENLWLPVV